MSIPHLIFIGSFHGDREPFRLGVGLDSIKGPPASQSRDVTEGCLILQAELLRSQLPSGDVNTGNRPNWRQDVSQALQQIPAAGVCLCSQTCCPNLPPVITILGNFPVLLSWASILSVALSKALVWTGGFITLESFELKVEGSPEAISLNLVGISQVHCLKEKQSQHLRKVKVVVGHRNSELGVLCSHPSFPHRWGN